MNKVAEVKWRSRWRVMLTFASKYEKFWKWFQSNQDEIFNFEANQE